MIFLWLCIIQLFFQPLVNSGGQQTGKPNAQRCNQGSVGFEDNIYLWKNSYSLCASLRWLDVTCSLMLYTHTYYIGSRFHVLEALISICCIPIQTFLKFSALFILMCINSIDSNKNSSY